MAGGLCVFYLKKHELLHMYSSLDIANHTGGIKSKSKHAADYIQQEI